MSLRRWSHPLEKCGGARSLWGSSMLKANPLRRAVEAERRVYAKGVATPCLYKKGVEPPFCWGIRVVAFDFEMELN